MSDQQQPSGSGVSRYLNQGLTATEAVFDQSHPRAHQYLDQAPILIMWALPWAKGRRASDQMYMMTWVADRCERGVPLKAFLRDAGFTAPMRAISARVIQPSHAGLYRLLARIDPVVLGRCLPKTERAQRKWLRALEAWASQWHALHGQTTRNGEAMFLWCVEHFGDAVPSWSAGDLADLQMNGRFNTAWGLKRALEEMDLWHRRLSLERELRRLPVGPDDAIDAGSLPRIAEVGPLTFRALITPRQIAEEGSIMHHCVATYMHAVFAGHSHIVSIREGSRRVATLELTGPRHERPWAVRQLRGPRNAPVSTSIVSAAALYARAMWDPVAR